MIKFHALLDRWFHQKISFSVFFRLQLSFLVLILVAWGLTLYQVQQTLKPSAKRVVEDTLADASWLLSATLTDDVLALQAQNPSDPDALDNLNTALQNAFAHPNPTWYDQKIGSQFHLYITDNQGMVLYDSQGSDVGADYSQWNDVYLTLQGKYGARSTEINGESVMYVASPIMHHGKRIGVLSLGKPVQTLTPYIQKSEQEIGKIMALIMALLLIFSVLMAWWLRHSIHTVSLYTQSLATDTPPHFYLGKELNTLTHNITAMKDSLENKAYVTDYVHTLTHELKSPLTAITASGEILAEELSPQERQTFSTLIIDQTQKLTTLVDKLLSLAKLEQPTFRLNRETIDLDELIHDCLHAQTALIKTKQKQVYCQPSGLMLTADKFWLKSSLQNLIDNALIHGQSQVFIHAHRQTTDQGNAILITIVNDSPPLADFVLQKAFDRYFSLSHHETDPQAHQSTPKPSPNPSHYKGTGLGLTLVKQIAIHHGGDVSLTQTDRWQGQTGNFVVLCLRLPEF